MTSHRNDDARSYLDRSLEFDPDAARFIAGLERATGDLDAARRRFRSFEDSNQGCSGRKDVEAAFLVGLAALARDQGHSERAEPRLVRAADLLLGDRQWLEGLLALWATVSAGQGRMARAARLLGAAESTNVYRYLPLHHPSEIDPYRECLADTLRAEEMRRLQTEGAAMSIEDAIDYARSGRDEPGQRRAP